MINAGGRLVSTDADCTCPSEESHCPHCGRFLHSDANARNHKPRCHRAAMGERRQS